MSARARRLPGWLTRRRILLGLAVIVVIGVRAALPAVVRSQIEKQTRKAITGRLTVGDVDLALMRGGVALDDVALYGENAGPQDPPLVSWKRLWVNLGWLALPWRTVRIEDIALDGLALNLDRLASGDIVLPKPVPSGEAPPEKPAEPGKPWLVVVDRAFMARGALRFTDRVATPPEVRKIALPTLALRDVRLQPAPDGRPGRVNLTLRMGGGKVDLKALVAAAEDGFGVTAYLRLADVPLDRANVHLPALGWSGLQGRVDGALTARIRPGAGPVGSGSIDVRDLAVDAPGKDGPELTWRRLAVVVDEVDLGKRTARVARVGLDGATVLVEPRASPPLPILRRPGAPAKASAEAPSAEAADEIPPPPPAEAAASPWRWRVGTVEVTDTRITVVLEPPPLDVVIVRAKVDGLASDPGSTATVALEVRPGEGTVLVDGTVGLDPLAAHLKVRPQGLVLGPLVAATGAAPVVLAHGTLEGDVDVRAEEEPLVVSGALALSDLEVLPREGEDFRLAWKALEVGMRAVKVPGVLPGREAAAGAPLSVELARVRLGAPVVALTRTEAGVVLPGAAPPAPAPEAGAVPAPEAPPQAAETRPSAEAPPATEAPPAEGGRPLALVLDDLALDDGEVTIVDRTAKPVYRGKVSAIDLRARDLRVPEGTFGSINLKLKAPGGAPLTVDARRNRDDVKVTGRLERLPLAQFNPYVTPSGYSVGRGTLNLRSDVQVGVKGYKADSKIELDRLAVGGGGGESLFQKRFGIPLSVALALMRDLNGRIALGVPLAGDREKGMQIDVVSIAGQALARAIVGAIASPLKLLGAVTLKGDRIEAFDPKPVTFVPGRSELSASAREQVGKLGDALAQLPGVGIEVAGSAGATDRRALSEAAVLVDLSADRGVFGTLRDLPTRRARNAIRIALEARARGEEGPLDPDYQERLDGWVAEKPIGDEKLRELAAARAEAVKRLLAEEHGVDAARVGVSEPVVDPAGKPEVTVTIG